MISTRKWIVRIEWGCSQKRFSVSKNCKVIRTRRQKRRETEVTDKALISVHGLFINSSLKSRQTSYDQFTIVCLEIFLAFSRFIRIFSLRSTIYSAYNNCCVRHVGIKRWWGPKFLALFQWWCSSNVLLFALSFRNLVNKRGHTTKPPVPECLSVP